MDQATLVFASLGALFTGTTVINALFYNRYTVRNHRLDELENRVEQLRLELASCEKRCEARERENWRLMREWWERGGTGHGREHPDPR